MRPGPDIALILSIILGGLGIDGSSRLSGERGVWGSFVLVRVLAIVAGEILPSDEEFPDHERR